MRRAQDARTGALQKMSKYILSERSFLQKRPIENTFYACELREHILQKRRIEDRFYTRVQRERILQKPSKEKPIWTRARAEPAQRPAGEDHVYDVRRRAFGHLRDRQEPAPGTPKP